MKNNRMDRKLEKQIEGLTPNQIKLLASIYAGMGERLRKKTAAECLAKWKLRNVYSRN